LNCPWTRSDVFRLLYRTELSHARPWFANAPVIAFIGLTHIGEFDVDLPSMTQLRRV